MYKDFGSSSGEQWYYNNELWEVLKFPYYEN